MGTESTRSAATLDKHAKTLYHCADCSYCVDAVWDERHLEHVCPTLEHHSPALSYSGRGYISLARAIFEGEEFPLSDLAERVYTCTSCGNCERVCPIGLSPRDVNLALREVLADNGAAPAAHSKYREKLLNVDIISSTDANSHLPWLDDAVAPESTLDIVDTLFLPGCEAPALAPEEVRACYAIVKAISPNTSLIEASVGQTAACCGNALQNLGFTSDAQQSQSKLSEQINTLPRVSDIVHLNAGCALRITTDSRHSYFVDWLAQAISDGRARASIIRPLEQVVFMNTCSNAQHAKSFAHLFQQLAIAPLNEDWTSNFPLCCGAGGGLTRIAEKSANKMARAKFDSLDFDVDGNISVIVPDAQCLAHLRNNAPAEKHQTKIHGLGEFIQAHFRIERASE